MPSHKTDSNGRARVELADGFSRVTLIVPRASPAIVTSVTLETIDETEIEVVGSASGLALDDVCMDPAVRWINVYATPGTPFLLHERGSLHEVELLRA